MKYFNSGYTLIELLITLSLLSILLSLPFITFPKLNDTSLEAEIIAKQVQETLVLAQQVAMSHGRSTQIRVDNSKKELTIRFSAHDVYSVTAYQHPNMSFDFLTMDPSSVVFLTNGHPSRSGAFLVRIGPYRYRFVVYLGKGMITYSRF